MEGHHDLRARFRALADEHAAQAPEFPRDALLARRASHGAHAARASWQLVAGASILAAAMVAFALWPREPELLELPVTTWVAPTDFLLDTPGSELLGSVPAITTSFEATATSVAELRDSSGRKEP